MATLAITGLGSARSARWRFVATIFTGSFLLFLVQPMIGRMVLPRLGGAPAVWNSAMLVYQSLLLAGYAYAHWIGRFTPRRQASIHLGLFALAAATLPIGLLDTYPSPDANPFVWVPGLLLLSIGPLFFVVSAQAPLIQRWFTLSDSADPYPLYAASNLGSFAGLIAYPFLVEPWLAVAEQRWLWSGGYVLLALLVGWCALRLPRANVAHDEAAAPQVRPRSRAVAMWILLAAVPSGLVMSTTLHLTTDIVAMPLIWVIPLALYLLSFTVAFAARRNLANILSAAAPAVLLLGAIGLFANLSFLPWVSGLIALLCLFVVSVALHKKLFERRPAPSQLTFFYLAMSVGGVLGGLFCALLAPLIFDWTYEHLLLLTAAAFLIDVPSLFTRRKAGSQAVPGPGLLFGTTVGVILLLAGGTDRLRLSAQPGMMTRSFFGIYTVQQSGPEARTLVHGTTVHGLQNRGSEERERMPTTYYVPESGVGLAMRAAPQLFGERARIGVVGLGTGTLACYGRPGQSWRFYEIDPAVADIARDPERFTFLSRCQRQAPIVIGDARLTLAQAPPASADLLVVDAFSSDSIPMHLLTLEAFGVYRRHLRSDGLLLIHITNRYLDLVPVIAAAAAEQGWSARIRNYFPDEAQRAQNHARSRWVALSPSPATLSRLTSTDERWERLTRRPGFAAWTDSHGSLLPLLHGTQPAH